MLQSQKMIVKLDLWVFDSKNAAHEFDGYLDTQAALNVIDQTLRRFLGHELQPYSGTDLVGLGDFTSTPLGQVKIFSRWKGTTISKLHEQTFVVVDKIPYEEKKKMEFEGQVQKTQQQAEDEAEKLRKRQEREQQRQASNQSGA
ncbi:hypothetical protein PG993_003881 [Apiospora rasikravindrae]|uniref:Uncharacterized protein n=1 Tax=Apiospora rasikravindrae TaxID=990691 RepID=A0ABR1U0R8_9PEZI